MLDSEILADVYAELMGGRQASLLLQTAAKAAAAINLQRNRPIALRPLASEAEIAAHAAFIQTIGEKAIWRKYLAHAEAPAERAAAQA